MGCFSLYQIIRGYVTIKNGGWSELVCWWSIGFLFICPTQKEIPLKIIFMSEVPVEHGNSSLAFSLRGVCLKIEDLYCHQRRKVLFYSLFFLGGGSPTFSDIFQRTIQFIHQFFGGFPMVFPTFSDNHWRVRESPRPARATCRVLIPSQLLMVSKAAARQLVGNLRLREGFRGWSTSVSNNWYNL